MGQLTLILRIAMRNLFANPINVVIGTIITFGTFLVVVGSSLLDSVDSSMSRSITGSVTGNLQVYSAKSKDELSVYGSFGGDPDLSPITNFAAIKERLGALPNVAHVVPMGISTAFINSGNTVDLTLSELRNVIRQEKDTGITPELKAREESLKDHVRQIVAVIKGDLKNLLELTSDRDREAESRVILDKAGSPAFWESFNKDPYSGLEFLENEVAPQVTDADLLQIRYVGTDLDLYQRAFDRMEIVDGQSVPPGHRGFIISKLYYEEFLKLKSARRLDKIKEAIDAGHGRKTIAGDPELQRYMKENQSQTREILFQLDSQRVKKAVDILQAALRSQETQLDPLLVSFFAMNDANFPERYRLFYDRLAPLLQLYRLRMGDNLTIKAFTRSGYMQAVNVKIFGTYRFQGMGDAPLAGSINLMDLMSFRDLYGYLTPQNVAELKALQEEGGVRHLEREKAEEALFGSGDVVTEAKASDASNARAKRELANVQGVSKERRAASERDTFTQADIDNGVVLNAALILKDPSKLNASLKAVKAASTQYNLGLKTMSWQEAAGFIGQMVRLLKLVLYFAVFIIFVVALVIINNAMMMATLQRVREIGTMRAVGAQRGFVLSMVLIETVVLGLVFGALGAALGSGVMLVLQRIGIPAGSDVVRFFFSGPRLYPLLGAWNIIVAFVIVLGVSAISTLFPAITATRVSPIRAMQTEE